MIGDCTRGAPRRAAVRVQVDLIGDAARRSIPEPRDVGGVEEVVERLDRNLADARTPE